MKKKYLLDTNVLINDPGAIYGFADNDVIIPTIVVRELDGLKKRQDATGAASRYVAKELDGLRDKGFLHQGVPLDNGGTLTIVKTPFTADHVPKADMNNDDRILQVCVDLGAILITEDINMRITADSLGIVVAAYENLRVDSTDMYEKCQVIPINSATSRREFFETDNRTFLYKDDGYKLHNNEYVEVEGGGLGVYVEASDEGGYLYNIGKNSPRAMNLKARNSEQRFALDALFDPGIDFVVLSGPAGCGKTLCAVAAGLEMATETNLYKSVSIARPTIPAGPDIGFLPGSMDEKLDPWMGPIWDSVDVLVPPIKGSLMTPSDYYRSKGHIKMLSIAYLRGRSLPKSVIIIDEAQNLSRHEAKMIVTRAGEGTKIVFTGDPTQIDNTYLDHENNGMSYVIDKFKGMSNFVHVFMHKGERSALAEMAANLL